MVLSRNLYGEIPNKILNVGEKQAEEALLWGKEKFQDDFYSEIMRHTPEDEDRVNKTLIAFSATHQVTSIATNKPYSLAKTDATAHGILLCVRDGEKQATPIGR